MSNKKQNPYALYADHKDFSKATRAITQGLNSGNITIKTLWDNPILERFRKVGAADTYTRDVIYIILQLMRRNKCKAQVAIKRMIEREIIDDRKMLFHLYDEFSNAKSGVSLILAHDNYFNYRDQLIKKYPNSYWTNRNRINLVLSH